MIDFNTLEQQCVHTVTYGIRDITSVLCTLHLRQLRSNGDDFRAYERLINRLAKRYNVNERVMRIVRA